MSQFNLYDAIQAYNELPPYEFDEYLSGFSADNQKKVHDALKDTYYNELIFSIECGYRKDRLSFLFDVVYQRLKSGDTVKNKTLLFLLIATGGPKKPEDSQVYKMEAIDHFNEYVSSINMKKLDMKKHILSWLEYIVEPLNEFEDKLRKDYLEAETTGNYDNIYKLMNAAIIDYGDMKLKTNRQLFDDVVGQLQNNINIDKKIILCLLNIIDNPEIHIKSNSLEKVKAINDFEIFVAFSHVHAKDEKEFFKKWLAIQDIESPNSFIRTLKKNPKGAYGNMNRAMNTYGDKKINK